MNQTHLHLMITHLPIAGTALGAVVMAYGLRTKSIQTQISAYFIFIISSIGATVSYLTGEAAEETVEKIAGITKNTIEEHEEFALITLVGLIILGVASVGAMILTIRRSAFTRNAAFVTLFISLISFGLAAWTGYLGGQIRHTEVRGHVTV
jgi:uncharacterized membrane protein